MAEKKPTKEEVATTPGILQNWKLKHKKLFQFDSEDGEKRGWFKMPDRVLMDAVSADAGAHPVRSNEMLAKGCFLGGDEELITDDQYFFGLSQKLKTLLQVKQGELVEL